MTIIVLLGCSKSEDDLLVNPDATLLKNAQSSISNGKQDREILFVSKRDGNIREMNFAIPDNQGNFVIVAPFIRHRVSLVSNIRL